MGERTSTGRQRRAAPTAFHRLVGVAESITAVSIAPCDAIVARDAHAPDLALAPRAAGHEGCRYEAHAFRGRGARQREPADEARSAARVAHRVAPRDRRTLPLTRHLHAPRVRLGAVRVAIAGAAASLCRALEALVALAFEAARAPLAAAPEIAPAVAALGEGALALRIAGAGPVAEAVDTLEAGLTRRPGPAAALTFAERRHPGAAALAACGLGDARRLAA